MKLVKITNQFLELVSSKEFTVIVQEDSFKKIICLKNTDHYLIHVSLYLQHCYIHI